MIELLMSTALAFGISFYALPAIIHVSKIKGIFDFPGERKVHINPVPSLGGVGIYAGFIIAFLLCVAFIGNRYSLQYFVAATLIMFFVGLKDDLVNLAPIKKFLGQIIAAALLVYKGGIAITSMGGIFGINELPMVASQLLSVLTIVVIINAYNLIDGIDGLAGSLSFISCAIFATYFAINRDWVFACLASSMAGAIAAFLIFNYAPARIFMGDTGSLIIGMVNAVLVIHFIEMAGNAPILAISSPAAIGYALLFVPLFDTLRVFSFRIINGISPFTPDRNHVHHVLLHLNWSHLKITLSLSAVSIGFIAFAFLMQDLGNTMLLILLNGMGFTIIGAVIYYIRHSHNRIEEIPRIEHERQEIPIIPVAAKKAAQ
ncbi:MAG TPA: MraY family glycosyltransferase [Phnomibacter sp.]|nr:MraY family glycosyltransferase [Phnomibacter sp.]